MNEGVWVQMLKLKHFEVLVLSKKIAGTRVELLGCIVVGSQGERLES